MTNLIQCPFCERMMGRLCLCGAYKVTKETSDLPLKKQPYFDLLKEERIED